MHCLEGVPCRSFVKRRDMMRIHSNNDLYGRTNERTNEIAFQISPPGTFNETKYTSTASRGCTSPRLNTFSLVQHVFQ
jgi:hypothetical protein